MRILDKCAQFGMSINVVEKQDCMNTSTGRETRYSRTQDSRRNDDG